MGSSLRFGLICTLAGALGAALSVAPAAADPLPPEVGEAESDAPWAQGKVRVGVGGGATLNLATTSFQINASVGYFFIDYVEGGLDLAFQFGSAAPSFTIIAGPAVRLLVPVDKHIVPYLGGFYHHYFVTDSAFKDLDTAGARAGLLFRTASVNVQLGILWERIVTQCSKDCDIVSPEIGATFMF